MRFPGDPPSGTEARFDGNRSDELLIGTQLAEDLREDRIREILEWKSRVLDYDELARTKSAGVCPVQRRNALVNALGSENPKRKATSSIPRFSFVK